MACSNPNDVRVDTIDITCDCDKFQTDGECNHIKPLSNDNRIREKLNGILGCRIDAYGFDTSINGWSVFSIPALPFDNTTVYKVYQRYHLSSVLNKSNTVIMERSRSRLRLLVKLRFNCLPCASSSCNRGLCVHEDAYMNSLSSELRRNGEEQNNYGNELDGNDSGSAEERTDDESTDYVSKKYRFFFQCCADENALNRVMCDLIEDNNESSGEFTGRDIMANALHVV